jgi:6-phosphogluconate dehydrogenase
MSATEIGTQFKKWNEGQLNSYLIEITGEALMATDKESGSAVVDIILDRAGQKGTGRWSVIESQMLGVPATAIEAAVASRSLSALKDQRQQAERLYQALPGGQLANRPGLIDDLGRALFAGKIAAYAQGFAVMVEASSEFSWNLPMATVAKIWRAGCIIRSQFLDTIADAYQAAQTPDNLLVASNFVPLMVENSPALRAVVAAAAQAGLPTPALGAALGYFDSYRQGRGTANMIQAQRDFFGAHGFERIDQDGQHHGPWAMNADN